VVDLGSPNPLLLAFGTMSPRRPLRSSGQSRIKGLAAGPLARMGVFCCKNKKDQRALATFVRGPQILLYPRSAVFAMV